MLDLSSVTILMGLYFVLCSGFIWAFSGTLEKTKESFLLADRKFETVRGAFSISAAWTWATALFLAPQLSYQYGFTGFFWILVMNTLTLFFFGFAANKIREMYPNGFTFSEHIKLNYGSVAHNTYNLAFILIATVALSLNIYAGSKLIQTLTGLNMNIAAGFLIVSAVLFSIFRGLRSTNITEIFKMVVVLTTAIVIVPQVWSIAGWETIQKGMTGANGKYGDLFSSVEALAFFWSTGIYFIFRHFSLPWADNSFWQRAFVINPTKIRVTYALAAAIFFIAPAMFATLGFVAAGMGITPSNLQLTNVAVIAQLLDPWALWMVVFMLLTALTSIIDSQITSVTTLISNDIVPQFKKLEESKLIDYSRFGVVAVVLLAWLVVNIPGVNILYFGLLTGCICMTFIVPSIIALVKPQLQNAKAMVTGILISLFVGFPIYAYASLNKINDIALIGFFGCLIVPTIFSLGISAIMRLNKMNPHDNRY
jgi:Na+/proline symporter